MTDAEKVREAAQFADRHIGTPPRFEKALDSLVQRLHEAEERAEKAEAQVTALAEESIRTSESYLKLQARIQELEAEIARWETTARKVLDMTGQALAEDEAPHSVTENP